MKSFDQTFSKVCAGRGREALVARRNERNSPNAISIRAANYWFISLWLLAQQERKRFAQCHAPYTPKQQKDAIHGADK
jgi:hypothetical protein